MSKKDKKKMASVYGSIGEADPVKLISNRVGKRGKLHGDKKEKKMLRNACPHHIITRKGKLRATTEQDGKGNVRCYICGDIIPMKFADDAEIRKATNGFYKYVTQGKLMAQAIGAGKKAIRQVTDTATLTKAYPKLYVNMRNVAQKQDKAKKNKKKKRYGGSSTYGSWGSRRY